MEKGRWARIFACLHKRPDLWGWCEDALIAMGAIAPSCQPVALPPRAAATAAPGTPGPRRGGGPPPSPMALATPTQTGSAVDSPGPASSDDCQVLPSSAAGEGAGTDPGGTPAIQCKESLDDEVDWDSNCTKPDHLSVDRLISALEKAEPIALAEILVRAKLVKRGCRRWQEVPCLPNKN